MKKMITGIRLSNGGFMMHSPERPYNSIQYFGYTEEEMKKKFRKDFGLEHKQLIWMLS